MAGKKHLRGLHPKCPTCGRAAAVFTTTRGGYRLHCPCGTTGFFTSPVLLERLAVNDPLCEHHEVSWKQARVGWTRWCPACRLRLFAYQPPLVVANAPVESPLTSP